VTLNSIAIVGAGLAGAKAAEALRKDGYDGRISMFGDEPHVPYLRPPLSKDYLRGESGVDAVLVHPPAWYDEHRIDLYLSERVEAIDPRAMHLRLDDGLHLEYDRLLLATGASPRRLQIPGSDLAGVHYLRSLDDADALRRAAAQAHRAVVVGGGWIGAEATASLRQLGLSVAMIAEESVPLERVLGAELGRVYRDVHSEYGVQLVMNQRVAAFQGQTTVEAVRLADGTTIQADLVVVGIGAQPRTRLARDAGLDVGNGVIVDAYLETTTPGIYAAGDIAAAWHPLLQARLRVEHWDNARRQGRTAARNMLGHREAYTRIPYFYSDQYDLGMEYAGYAPRWDRVVFRGNPGSRAFVAFWLLEGRAVAGMNVNVWKVNEAIAALVASHEKVAVERLVDPSVPLDDIDALLLPPAASAG
jgi:3-phenylpropionate/trans-cinnamate dioxygenase ferredoxin reductase component